MYVTLCYVQGLTILCRASAYLLLANPNKLEAHKTMPNALLHNIAFKFLGPMPFNGFRTRGFSVPFSSEFRLPLHCLSFTMEGLLMPLLVKMILPRLSFQMLTAWLAIFSMFVSAACLYSVPFVKLSDFQ